MATFRYANPAAIHWGAGCVRGLGEAVGARVRVLLVTTRSALPELAPAVREVLGESCIGTQVVGQHAPAAEVMAVAEAARGSDALVSLGGGSPTDAAKAAAFSLATGLDLREPDAPARARAMHVADTLPHFAVPTTLSAAELSGSAGFSAEGTREKVGVNAPALIPTAVFYDAELAVKTPLRLWLSTGIRAVDHAVETLLAEGEHPLPDAAALEGLRRLKGGLLAAHAQPEDLGAREEGQLGAWLSYLLPGKAAAGLSHMLGKRIGASHGIPHGITSCMLLPHVIRRQPPSPALQQIAAALGASDAADGVQELIDALGLRTHLSDFGLTQADLREAARPLVSERHPESELVEILEAAM